jgi:hypothetical protein
VVDNSRLPPLPASLKSSATSLSCLFSARHLERSHDNISFEKTSLQFTRVAV